MSLPLNAIVHSRAATLWLASTLVLFVALAPSLSMVLRSAATGTLSIEVCSTLAAKLAKASQPLANPSSQHGVPHCPLCVLPGTVADLPPAVGGLMQMAAGPSTPGFDTRPPLQAGPRLLALPRAPPFLV